MSLKTVKIVTNIVLVVYATRAAVRCVAHSFMFLLPASGGEEANGEGGREMGPSHGLCHIPCRRRKSLLGDHSTRELPERATAPTLQVL